MDKKGGISMAFYWPGIKETPELAVPKKEPDTRYRPLTENYFFGVQVELLIKAVYLGQDKDQY